MADAKQQARAEVRRTQADFERKVAEARLTRRKSFERAQKVGLSLRDIGKAAGLHHSRVAEIIKGR
jgi:hypothetical protein